MHVITLAAFKGGSGKTLMAASMAVLAAMQGIPEGNDERPDHRGVAMIDLDPQGSLTVWSNLRQLPFPAIAQISPVGLTDGLKELKAMGFQTVVIDTPPGHGAIVVTAMAAADLVVIPIKPGELDFEAAMNTVATAERLGRPYSLLPNDATYRSIAMGRTIRMLSDAGLRKFSAVHHRVNAALIEGRTALERAPNSLAATELRAVWRELSRMLWIDEVAL